jgi:transposase-like protein
MHRNFLRFKEVMLLYGIGFRDLVLLNSMTNVRDSAFIIDETVIQISNQHFWLWMCKEPIQSFVLGIYISKERNMFVAEKCIHSLVYK